MSDSTASRRSLAALTADLIATPEDVFVTDLTLDSRTVSPGALFLACRGRTHHGLEFAAQAVARGARAVLFESDETHSAAIPDFGSDIYVAGVPQLSQRVGTIADRFFDTPSLAMTVAGITGTNGKTTTAYLLSQALGLCGRPATYMGTLGSGFPNDLRAGTHTTADAVSVHRQLDELRRLGASCACMEVSSHALDQARVEGVRFHTAVFTNLTRDHLDYHGTFAAYGAAKALLFSWPALSTRVINVDDAFGAELAARAGTGQLVVTTRDATQQPQGQFVCAVGVEPRSTGLGIRVVSSWGDCSLTVPLIGDFNVDNVLAVLAVLLAWGVPLKEAADALSSCHAPSGRMETLGVDEGPLVIVDYAHTPDALEKALRAARMHCRGRLSVVFGCGGDRDTGKRPLMGAVASRLADELIITDDNPRTEAPQRIVADIRAGLDPARAVHVEHDRARAILGAMNAAGAGDVVLIAGKGHEDYQIYGHESRPFSDQAVVRDELKRQACSAR